MGVVRFPPDDNDAAGWVRGLLTDLAGGLEGAAELLAAVQAACRGEAAGWSMGYNVYAIRIEPGGAFVTFAGDSCPVPLDVLEAVVAQHLRESPRV